MRDCERVQEARGAGGLSLSLSLPVSRPLQHHGSQCATLETRSADSLHPLLAYLCSNTTPQKCLS